MEANVSSENPALLILDAHQSRLNLDALTTAQQKGLQIVVLSGSSTAFLQPLDKAIFKAFKQQLRIDMNAAQKKGDTIVKKDKFTKVEVIKMAKKTLELVLTLEKIKYAFECTGIELWAPQTTLEKLQKKNSIQLSNDDLRTLLAPNMTIQKLHPKQPGKKIHIANKIATSEELLDALCQNKQNCSKNTKQQKI